MKELSSRQLSPVVATALKVVGIVMVLGTLFSVLFSLMPYALQDREWVRDFTTYIGDRGIIPLMGFVLFLAGFWVESLAGSASRLLPTIAVTLACALSAFYVLLTVLHVSNVLAVQSNELDAVAEQSARAEQQLDSEIENQIGQRRALISQLLENAELRGQAVSRGLISADDAAVLDEFEDDPEQLETYLQGLESQAEDLRSEQQAAIAAEREEERSEIETRAVSLNLRIGLLNVLWAIGYAALGWTGLKWFRYRD
ncbi:MAG: HpsJ family protein [Elainellaceae cyanobacterium]